MNHDCPTLALVSILYYRSQYSCIFHYMVILPNEVNVVIIECTCNGPGDQITNPRTHNNILRTWFINNMWRQPS